ncbi:hypothetical protein [Dactylosporangium sp. CA-233914]
MLAHRPGIAARYERLPLRPATPHALSSRRQLDGGTVVAVVGLTGHTG